MMGVQLIEQSRLHGVKKFVATGTVCAYPKFTPVPFKEDDLWNGYPEETNAPYGLAKKMMLVQAQAYRQQYGFQFDPPAREPLRPRRQLRSRNVARDSGFDSKMRRGAPWPRAVWPPSGAPAQCRAEFLYVEDCTNGIVKAAASYNESDPVNLGNGREVVIKDLVEIIARLTGYQGEIKWQSDKPDGQPRRQLDTRRAFEKFGFRAQTSLEDGLRKTIDWYETSFKVQGA